MVWCLEAEASSEMVVYIGTHVFAHDRALFSPSELPLIARDSLSCHLLDQH